MPLQNDKLLRLASAVRSCLGDYPFYVVWSTLYWLWTGLVFQGPAFYSNKVPPLLPTVPSWWVPMIFYALSYVIIGVGYARAIPIAAKKGWPVALAAAMGGGAAACVLWMNADTQSLATSAFLYYGGSFGVSFGAAGFLSLLSRFNGYVGPYLTLVCGAVSLVCAAAIMLGLSFLPQAVCHGLLVVLPWVLVPCVRKLVRLVPRRVLFRTSREKDALPKKLLATSALHGLPFGFSLMLLSSGRTDAQVLLFNAVCFACGAFALLSLMGMRRLDFNRLIYVFGFPLMGTGLACIAVLPGSPDIGCAVLTVGYAFVHVTMCGVNAYLGKQFGVPMPWILSVTTCCFMGGQAVGVLLGTVSTLADAPVQPPAVAVVVPMVCMFASVLLVDNRNMQYGWGVVDPSSVAAAPSPAEQGRALLAKTHGLTEREADVLALLAAGRSRRHIGQALCIGEETVKSHVKSIYTKLDVHSKEELISAVEKCSAAVDEPATAWEWDEKAGGQ